MPFNKKQFALMRVLLQQHNSTVQNMRRLYFGMLNKAMAVEECDATKA